MPVLAVRRRPCADDDSYHLERERRLRLAVIAAIICIFVVGPAISDAVRKTTPASVFMLAGSVAFVGLVVTLVLLRPARPGRADWAVLVVTVGLGLALFTVGGEASLVILALAAAACGSFTRTPRPAIAGAIVCGAAGLGVAVADHYSFGDLALVTVVPSLPAFLAYTTGKRNEMLGTLRQTRAELAQAAVAQERLRIARDLHDLLGHSLSLITLKAELSRRMISTDTETAAREMSELEAVARQSLSDVREAVAGYRQRDLVAELGAARQLMSAAGLDGQITSPEDLSLPPAADTVLAWTVREGVTNVVRHARATSAAVRITTTGQGVMAEITDNGRGHSPGPAGSGLTGLGERVRQLGGSLIACPAPSAGFRLQVTIPVPAPAPGPGQSPSPSAPLSLAS
jgi:two-component system, NarL family, sensor histidine kinase DesK